MEGGGHLALLFGLVALLAACGSARHARPYSGHLYSVAQVRAAFAQLGLELHTEKSTSPGLVQLVNDRHLGPQHLPSPPGIVTVVVATRRAAVGTSTRLPGRLTSYANVAAFSKPYAGDEARAAISALRWGTFGQLKAASDRIELGSSIGAVRLWEARKEVEKALGKGVRRGRGVIVYPRQHLVLDYAPHDTLVPWVGGITTRWSGFRGPAGVHVGSTRQALRALYVGCGSETQCGLQAGAMPDAPGTIFTLRHGKVVEIGVFAV
jgi:hypothetical protein